MPMTRENLGELAERAKELEKQGDLQGALDCHLRILESHQDDPVIVFNAHGYIANLYMRMERPADAQRHLETAIEMNGDDEAYYYALGGALVTQGRYAEAAEAYKKAAVLAPEIAELHRARAGALLAAGQLAEAQAAYLTAHRMDTKHTPTVAGLVAVLAKQGRLDEAERLLRSALASDPDDALLRCAEAALLRLRRSG
jgi:tetratricopeptide (TPR) repeat protein